MKLFSRLYGLENLRDNFEGFQEGVKSIMFWQKQVIEAMPEEQRPQYQSFRPVSEVVQVPQEYELALESALGPKLQMLLSENKDKSLEAVDYLKAQKSGRSTFYSQGGALQSHDSGETGLVQSCRGYRQMLRDVIQVPQQHVETVNSLLDRVAVVENIRDGIEMHQQFPSWTFVTTDGDVFTHEGVLSGGHSGDASSGVLQRQREIKELKLAKEEWSGKLSLVQAAAKKMETQLKQVTENLEGAQKEGTEKEILVAGLKKDLEQAELEVENVVRAFSKQEATHDQILQKQTTKGGDLEQLLAYLQELKDKKQETEQRIEELTQLLETEKLGITELQEKVTSLQVESAKKEQELIGVRTEHDRLERSLADVREQMSKMDQESCKNTQSMSENQVAMEEKKVELEILIQKVSEQEAQVAKMRDNFEQSNARMYELQEIVSQMMSEKNRYQTIMNDAQLILEQSKMKEENLIFHIEERYQKNLSEVAPQYMNREGDEEASRKRNEVSQRKVGANW